MWIIKSVACPFSLQQTKTKQKMTSKQSVVSGIISKINLFDSMIT